MILLVHMSDLPNHVGFLEPDFFCSEVQGTYNTIITSAAEHTHKGIQCSWP